MNLATFLLGLVKDIEIKRIVEKMITNLCDMHNAKRNKEILNLKLKDS